MKKSGFQFKGYKIAKSLIEIKPLAEGELSISFEPKGIKKEEKNEFTLILKTFIFNEDRSINIEVKAIAEYEYKDIGDDNLENLLYTNAPAILFPYIRAYISTLTNLSGVTPINLPTLNLLGLRESLEKNISTE